MSRPIPDSECKYGKCTCTTAGCWNRCAAELPLGEPVFACTVPAVQPVMAGTASVWWAKGTGGFYLNYKQIPEHIKSTGLTELVERAAPVAPVTEREGLALIPEGQMQEAINKIVDAAYIEALQTARDICFHATADRESVNENGEAAHYAACAGAIDRLARDYRAAAAPSPQEAGEVPK